MNAQTVAELRRHLARGHDRDALAVAFAAANRAIGQARQGARDLPPAERFAVAVQAAVEELEALALAVAEPASRQA